MVIFHRTVFVGIALWCLLLLGAVSCVLRITRYKYFVKTPGMILLALFLVSYIISSFVKIKYVCLYKLS